ncbi:MAG: hypothetical protein ACFFCO_07025 [Promethearchaeota archaeon]
MSTVSGWIGGGPPAVSELVILIFSILNAIFLMYIIYEMRKKKKK